MTAQRKPPVGWQSGRGLTSNGFCGSKDSARRESWLGHFVVRIQSARWRICCGRASRIIDGLQAANDRLRERLAALEGRDA